jgi:hypothetical protein
MKNSSANLFIVFGAAAIIAGGLLSAFSAHSAEYFTAWSVAYIVLVVGVVQVALGLGVRHLAPRAPSFTSTLTAFLLFNLGNAAIITSTVLYYTSVHNISYLVPIGSISIASAMVLFVRFVRGAKKSLWSRAYYALLCVVLVSVIAGLFLSMH